MGRPLADPRVDLKPGGKDGSVLWNFAAEGGGGLGAMWLSRLCHHVVGSHVFPATRGRISFWTQSGGGSVVICFARVCGCVAA